VSSPDLASSERRPEFPFAWAVLSALILHFCAGIFLRWVPLSSVGTPAVAPKRKPMEVTFVEVPRNATTVPYARRTPYASDANRKAGSLNPGTGAAGKPGSSPAGRAAQGRREEGSHLPQQAVLPGLSAAPRPDQAPGDFRRDSGRTRGPAVSDSLAKSLDDLQRFIRPAPGTGTGDETGEGGNGLTPVSPGSGVFFDTRGYDLGPWASKVIAIVKSNWLTPVAAQLGAKGVVSVSFTVSRSGRIDNIQLVSSSGIPSFDSAAIHALQSSSPLPDLPIDFPRPVLPGLFRFFYNMPVEDEGRGES
jgi:TonB family protein